MNERRHHTRTKIPDRRKHPVRYVWTVFRWRVAVATVTYPVQMALVIAIMVCSVPTYLVIGQQNQLDQAQVDTHKGRVASSRVFCDTVNDTIRGVNAEADYIKGLITEGAKQSKVFEPVYRQFGAPPYKERVRQAEAQAAGLDKLKTTPLNCVALQQRIERERGSR